jgi:hypothetical protein
MRGLPGSEAIRMTSRIARSYTGTRGPLRGALCIGTADTSGNDGMLGRPAFSPVEVSKGDPRP